MVDERGRATGGPEARLWGTSMQAMAHFDQSRDPPRHSHSSLPFPGLSGHHKYGNMAS